MAATEVSYFPFTAQPTRALVGPGCAAFSGFPSSLGQLPRIEVFAPNTAGASPVSVVILPGWNVLDQEQVRRKTKAGLKRRRKTPISTSLEATLKKGARP